MAQAVKPLGANIWHYTKVEIVPPFTAEFFNGPAGKALEKSVTGAVDKVIDSCQESIRAQEEEERRKIREKEETIKKAVEAKRLEAEAKFKAKIAEAEAKAKAEAAKAKAKADEAAAKAKTEPAKDKKKKPSKKK